MGALVALLEEEATRLDLPFRVAFSEAIEYKVLESTVGHP
jgi:hypothetical protein